MKLVQLMSSVKAEDVVAAWKEQWNEDEWSTVESFEEFRERFVNKTISVKDGLHFLVVKCRERKGKDYWDVSSSPDGVECYAFDFTPWEEARELEIVNDTKMTDAQIAATAYYEMTWHGWPESTRERLDSIHDAIEDIERGGAELIPFDPDKYFRDSPEDGAGDE